MPRSRTRFQLSWFTLAELIVVVTILAILAAVGFLALSGYSQDAKDAAVKANVRSVYAAISSESAATNNSPRYYVVHDAAAALTWAVAYADGNLLALTGGDWNQAGTNYSAGNPDWTKLKLNPDKFRLSSIGSRFAAAFGTAEAAYDPKLVSVGAFDAALAPTVAGRARSAQFFQVTWTSPVTGSVSVSGNYPSGLGGISGLVKNPASSGTQDALVENASYYPGCDTADVILANGQRWAACNVGAGTAYVGQNVTLADTSALTGGPTAAQKAYMGAYYQWGRNVDVTNGGIVAGPLSAAVAASETRFITNATPPNDWITPQDDNLWGGGSASLWSGTYHDQSEADRTAMKGPCAAGYHVPTQAEWYAAISALTPTVTNTGWWQNDASVASTLKLPLAGMRTTSGTYFYGGTLGCYWMSSSTGTASANCVRLSTTQVNAAYTGNRAGGWTVRCLAN